MSFGDVVLSLVIGAGAGVGMYFAHALPAFQGLYGGNRLRASVMVGGLAAALAYLLRTADIF